MKLAIYYGKNLTPDNLWNTIIKYYDVKDLTIYSTNDYPMNETLEHLPCRFVDIKSMPIADTVSKVDAVLIYHSENYSFGTVIEMALAFAKPFIGIPIIV
jgi:hypothetical protein